MSDGTDNVTIVSTGPDLGPVLDRISLSLFALASVFIILRFFTRFYIVKRFGLDDLFIAIAFALDGVQTVGILLQVENGRGRHANTVRLKQFNRMLLWKWINMLVYFVANWAVKMSILALYYRIVSGKRGLPWIVQPEAVWWIAGVITSLHIAVFTAQFFACIPVSRAWDVMNLPKGCINDTTFMEASAAINVATDIVLLILPMPLLSLFKYNKRKQTALAVVLCIGLIPVIASSLRLGEIALGGNSSVGGPDWRESDATWKRAWVPVWSQMEVNIGIVAASLPCLSPLVKRFSTQRESNLPTFAWYRQSWRSDVWEEDEDFDKGKKKISEQELLDQVNKLCGAKRPEGEKT